MSGVNLACRCRQREIVIDRFVLGASTSRGEVRNYHKDSGSRSRASPGLGQLVRN